MAIQHSNLPCSEIHIPYSFKGDSAYLNGLLNSVLDADVGKLGFNTDDDTLSMLIKQSGSFQWKAIGSGSGAFTAADIGCTQITGSDYAGTTVQAALNWLRMNPPLSHPHIIGEVTGLQTALDLKVNSADILSDGKILLSLLPTTGNNAVVTLGNDGYISDGQLSSNIPKLVGGKLPDSVIPSLALVDVHVYQTVSERDLHQSIMQQGDVVIITDTSETYIWSGTAWQKMLTPVSGLTSFNTRSGPAIMPTSGDYSAAQIDCTTIVGAPGYSGGNVQQALNWVADSSNHAHTISQITDLSTALNNKVNTVDYNQANGWCKLNSSGKVDIAQLAINTGENSVVVLDNTNAIPIGQIPTLPSSKITHAGQGLPAVISSLQSSLEGKANSTHTQDWSTIAINPTPLHWAGSAPSDLPTAINRIAAYLYKHLGDIPIPE